MSCVYRTPLRLGRRGRRIQKHLANAAPASGGRRSAARAMRAGLSAPALAAAAAAADKISPPPPPPPLGRISLLLLPSAVFAILGRRKFRNLCLLRCPRVCSDKGRPYHKSCAVRPPSLQLKVSTVKMRICSPASFSWVLRVLSHFVPMWFSCRSSSSSSSSSCISFRRKS